jgi:hypothetical protein
MDRNRTRARRRADLARMKRRAVRIRSRSELTEPKYWVDGISPDPRRHEKMADHLASCSCPGCGNPRRWFGEKTLQEMREEQDDPLSEDR